MELPVTLARSHRVCSHPRLQPLEVHRESSLNGMRRGAQRIYWKCLTSKTS